MAQAIGCLRSGRMPQNRKQPRGSEDGGKTRSNEAEASGSEGGSKGGGEGGGSEASGTERGSDRLPASRERAAGRADPQSGASVVRRQGAEKHKWCPVRGWIEVRKSRRV
jgi:hypothetical protein